MTDWSDKFNKINQMLCSIAHQFNKTHARVYKQMKKKLQQFMPFNDLSPVRCNVRYVVKESIHIKNNNVKQNESIFYLFLLVLS